MWNGNALHMLCCNLTIASNQRYILDKFALAFDVLLNEIFSVNHSLDFLFSPQFSE